MHKAKWPNVVCVFFFLCFFDMCICFVFFIIILYFFLFKWNTVLWDFVVQWNVFRTSGRTNFKLKTFHYFVICFKYSEHNCYVDLKRKKKWCFFSQFVISLVLLLKTVYHLFTVCCNRHFLGGGGRLLKREAICTRLCHTHFNTCLLLFGFDE